MTRLRDKAATLLVAVQFLTRLPVPGWAWSPERQTRAVRWYPLVGMGVGAVGALVWLAASMMPPIVAVLLSIAATLMLTGAFHEDGLADTFDGVGGGTTRARALEIMRDSRIGTYGAAALGIVLAIKAASLVAVAAVPLALIAGHGLSRLSAVIVIATAGYARDDGTGKFTADGVDAAGLGMALVTGVGLAALLGWQLGASALVAALAGLALGHGAARLVFERKLGGYTGDCLGATQQLSEVGLYLGLVAAA